jgi:hypothetical protein
VSNKEPLVVICLPFVLFNKRIFYAVVEILLKVALNTSVFINDPVSKTPRLTTGKINE